MRILFDARFTRTDHHDGISRYGASLIAALARTDDVVMLISDPRQLALLPDVPFVRITSPLSPAELFVARRINRLKPDVVVCPMQTMGSWGRRYPLVLTLHDLIYYENPTPPSFLPLPVRLLWRLYHLAYWPQRLLLNRADVVATISATTAGLIARHRLTRRPVLLVGNAPQPAERRRDPDAPRSASLLYMGSFMPYKNVETLVRAVALLPGHTLHLLSRITPARRAELTALPAAEERVRFHDGVSDAEYEDLLLDATALVTLSRAEGYGLPIIEAMATGTPVVASDIPIFREVGGTAALYVDPDDPHAVAAAVRSLDEPGCWAEASRAGVAQAATYTWTASAEQLRQACRRAIDEYGRRRFVRLTAESVGRRDPSA
ncbi:glycosyltransferase family 4 protein [Arthrobacter agilis]|uniref:glycosyltransferase family 4 protein n=1 Tax=Arthrobacter agilis TaxID=37921 RepID=UPI0027875FF0|nr:glycosyltransferase family 1 protein [Arthrobacter agilis]MDQ0734953.1 glycosyltransferase involved in cell wall biosynthesis [Arthrobacter agilis]